MRAMIDLIALRGALAPFDPEAGGALGAECRIDQRKRELLSLKWPLLANAWEAEARQIIAERKEGT